ncbi:ABC transporter ATP-binding protein [Glycomyces salinus]|uniref:ABC transporter ATP-binding protein n=1 Tax=Glycomyces salinus TaxID=980294 RepID=UPI0018EDC8BF|nr:ATP-binding cassette domain-containing protein [Glycomyces salinus]
MSALLAAEELSFAYRSGEPILTEWSASFYSGETVAVTGPSGAGKSTLLYLLGLMLRPGAGQVLLEGEPVSDLPDARRADLRATEFGFVFQDAALDPTRTVIDNIAETALYRGQPRAQALAAAEVLMDRFGVGLRSRHRPGQISGGQAQRIALCRALLARPAIILADEPTGNLDPDTSRLVVSVLREHAAAGNSVIIVTHNHDIAAACDRIVEVSS